MLPTPMITEYCLGCRHLAPDMVACVYILNTKTSRAFTMKQPSGDGCRCWEPGGRDDRMRDAIRDEVRARLEAKRREHLHTHMMALYKRGCTDTEIAERCGVGLGAVKHWRRTRMLPVNAARTTGYDLYRELYEQGLSDRQMADKLGVPARRVSRWRWNKALPPNIPKEVQP